MREEDVEAVRRGYEAWNRGDDGFRGFIESWLESFEDLSIVPEELLVEGDCVVAMVRQRGRGRGSGYRNREDALAGLRK